MERWQVFIHRDMNTGQIATQ